MKVMKFGGTSVADADAIRRVVAIVADERRGEATSGPVVVVSALGGVTDRLLEVAARAKRGDAVQAQALVDELYARHLETLAALVAPQLAPRLPRPVGWLLSVGGVVAIGTAVVVIDEATPFPGYAAALPVLGTAAVLLAGSSTGLLAPPVHRFLDNPVMRRVGDWSYSLYLWHWPALVLTERNAGRPLTAVETAVVVLVVLAIAIYFFVFNRPGSAPASVTVDAPAVTIPAPAAAAPATN